MLVDLRNYTYHHCHFYKFLAFYKEIGFPLTTKHLGTTLTIGTSASGVANQTFQFFAYDDHDHRDKCRFGLRGDQAWLDYVGEASPMISLQENRLMVTTPNCPIQTPADIQSGWARKPGAAHSAEILEMMEFRCRAGQLGQAVEFIDQQVVGFVDGYTNRNVLSFMSQSDGLDSIILLASYDRFQVMQNMRAAELANHELQAAYREAASFLAGRTTRHIVPVPYVG